MTIHSTDKRRTKRWNSNHKIYRCVSCGYTSNCCAALASSKFFEFEYSLRAEYSHGRQVVSYVAIILSSYPLPFCNSTHFNCGGGAGQSARK